MIRIRARYQRGPAVSGAADAAGRGPGSSWRVKVSIRQAYGVVSRDGRLPLSDPAVAGMAVAVALAVHRADWRTGGVIGGLMWLALQRREQRRATLLVMLLACTVLAGARSESEHARLDPRSLGDYEGWGRLVDDPQPYGPATRAIIEIDGERFELWARGRAVQIRIGGWRGGQRVRLAGERVVLDPERRSRVAWQHVVGELRLDWVSDVAAGGPIDRASNRVRAAIERGGSALPGDDGALYRGLVVGDDRDQPRAMIERFRASGLSHLTAVSGQNVSFVLAAAGPALRVLRPWARWALTLALVAWFVSLTRFEPSIVRAGAMAALSATAFVLGRERAPARLLGLAVIALLLVDPLLVHSVGFWLSVGATAGVTSIGPWLAVRFESLGMFAMPVGVTLGAQVGVVIPAVWVFGRLPLVSVPANLLAVPVAGFVMLYGLPAGLVAGCVPAVAPVVMFPCRLGVRWVDTVAALGARLEPGGAMTWLGWGGLVAVAGCSAAKQRRRVDRSVSGVVAGLRPDAAKNAGRHGSASVDR